MNNPDDYLSRIQKQNSSRRALEERLNLSATQVEPVTHKPKPGSGALVDRNKQALKEIQAQAVAKSKSGKMAKLVVADLAIGALSLLGF